MNNHCTITEYELLSEENLNQIVKLSLELWPNAVFDEELKNWKELIDDDNHYVMLGKIKQAYIGFIHVSVRNDYVEGSDNKRNAYVEAIYIKIKYRLKGIANQLIKNAEIWAKSSGLMYIASDTEISNSSSQLFHQSVGFIEVNRIICYLKKI